MTTKSKINYFEEGLKEIRQFKKEDTKPKILVHVCCGACSCYPLLFLTDLFDITVFFSNSNIYPYSEYLKRLEATKKYIKYLNSKFNASIDIIEDNYDYENFSKDLQPFCYESEGKNRCKICINKRMQRLFEYAALNKYEIVTTVMTISRNKNAEYINELGKTIEKKYNNVKFLVFDFKKNNGQDIGVDISKKLEIYRQDYCGCEFSIRNENEKNN